MAVGGIADGMSQATQKVHGAHRESEKWRKLGEKSKSVLMN